MDTIFELIKDNKELNEIQKSDPDTRLAKMFDLIFKIIYQQFSPSLLDTDKVLFALRLSQIRMEQRGSEEFDILMKTPTVMDLTISSDLVGSKLSESQLAYLQYLNSQQEYAYLVDHMENNEGRWLEFMSDPKAENNVPELPGDEDLSKNDSLVLSLRRLVLIKVLRPDRFGSAIKEFIHQALENRILDDDEMNFGTSVEEKSSAKSPLLLVSAPGYDASTKVEEIAKTNNKKLFSIAIGAAECYDIAEKSISSASKIGGWVLLKNVHLAPGWLVDIEKKLHRLNHHKGFRIFMTMEFNPKIPSTLLRMSMIHVFEPPSGIKASLMRTYGGIVNPQRSEKAPKERCRMHFLLSWFHAVIQERLRFTPIGWSKKYEFNESDQRGSLDAVDEWITKATKEMSDNIDPKNIPWNAIRTLISETIYGGKVDNEYDGKILTSLTEQFFTPKSFENSFELFKVPSTSDVVPLVAPEGRKCADYKKWIDELPNVESPLWCGLPVNVDNILKKRQVLHLIESFKQLQGIEDQEASGGDTDSSEKGAVWLQKLNETVSSLIGFLPESMPQLERDEEKMVDPLFRFLIREVMLGGELLEVVRKDLIDLKLMSTGEIKVTNDLREISRELDTDNIPKKWRIYKVASITATEWVIDFVKRLTQLKTLSEMQNFKDEKLWIGGFFFPEALITATRQLVAEKHGWSLEELDLIVIIGQEQIENDQCFIIESLTLEGYEWSSQSGDVVASDLLSTKLPTTTFKWIRKQDKESIGDSSKITQIPVYLNNERLNLLFSVKIVSEQPRTELYQRGIALVSWSTG